MWILALDNNDDLDAILKEIESETKKLTAKQATKKKGKSTNNFRN